MALPLYQLFPNYRDFEKKFKKILVNFCDPRDQIAKL